MMTETARWAVYHKQLGWLYDESFNWGWNAADCQEFPSGVDAMRALDAMRGNGHEIWLYDIIILRIRA
jgi:hypothetical protein